MTGQKRTLQDLSRHIPASVYAKSFCCVARVIAVLGITGITSCAINQHNAIKRFKGYWTAGVAYSYFTLLDGSESYIMVDDELPPEAIKLLRSQHSRADPFHSGPFSSSIYIDAIATIDAKLYSPAQRFKEIHVRRIMKMEPAPREFYATKNLPLPKNVASPLE
jgi:hypothetical protein